MGLSRRELFKAGALGGAGALLGTRGEQVLDAIVRATATPALAEGVYTLTQPESILYGLCLQCSTQCTLKAKTEDGLLTKLDGNPYSPMSLQPQLPYDAPAAQAAVVDGSICLKGQTGVQAQYDPYRLRKVLKRAGPRGSGRWKTIAFEQAIAEIADGGKLFADIGDDRQIPGFKDVFVLRDATLSKAMADDVAAIRAGASSVEAFKAKYRQYLGLLIDPNHPDLGPKNNQFVFLGGRVAPDRELNSQRFTFGTLGSINWYAHATICAQAHDLAFSLSTAQWKEDHGTYRWEKGTEHMKPDYTQAEFVIFWGTGYAEANVGPPPLSPQLSKAMVEGRLKIAVVDPRLSKTAAKGWWIRPTPGGDLALAMGMIRWIIEHERYDARFLRNAGRAAATGSGEKSWTNATWLVHRETGKLVRADEAGVGGPDAFVALAGGKPVAVDPDSESSTIVADLDVETVVGGSAVASGFRLLKEAALAHPLEFYAAESGVDAKTIADLADEFTSHGKKAAIDFYRGAVKFTYGYYAAQSIVALNYLIGNVDHRGGLVPGGGTWNAVGDAAGQPFNLKALHPGALTPFGIKLTREASGSYESSTLFARDAYPAKRPWFPLTSDVYQEVIPAAAAGYPYPIEILWLHQGSPAFSAPAGHLQIAMLRDTDKIPLFIATDIVIGETSMYADYIFPDLSYLERWGSPIGTSPVTLTKTTKIRQPVAAPVVEVVKIDGEDMPISLDAMMLALANRLRASGYGTNGFARGIDFRRPEDLYLKMVANVAWGDNESGRVPEASTEEVVLFENSRGHLPASVFDEAKWKRAVGPHWRRTVYVLNRGGRFESAKKAYDGAYVAHAWGRLLDLYSEPVGSTIHSITGRRFSGVPRFERTMSFDGKPVADAPGFDLRMFTYKEISGCTVSNYASQLAVMPENAVYVNAVDANRLGLLDGDLVRVVSPNFDGRFEVGPGQSVEVTGHVRAIEGIKPGAAAISWHYGHWAYGARTVEIDGQAIPGEAARAKGLLPTPLMGVDGYLKDLCLTDPIAGDSAFGGGSIKLVKLGSRTTYVTVSGPPAR